MTVTYAIRHEVLLNPVVRSWIQHYGAFYRTAPPYERVGFIGAAVTSLHVRDVPRGVSRSAALATAELFSHPTGARHGRFTTSAWAPRPRQPSTAGSGPVVTVATGWTEMLGMVLACGLQFQERPR